MQRTLPTQSITSSLAHGASPFRARRIALALTAGLLTCAGSSVFAATSQSVIEEVLVTAQKREQSMQDVSVAVTAFSGAAIEKMGFEEGLDITQQVPNMNFFAIFGEASSPSISLRGISLVNFSDSWESPVALYVDDVYRGNPAGSAIQLFDLERVEVLRGPQGTLYGRNTTGGLVHYVSKNPTEVFESSASVSYGSYAETIVEGVVSGPLREGLRGRVAFKRTHNDGWQTNAVDGQKLNDTNSFGYRAKLAMDIEGGGQAHLNVNGSRADQQSVGFAHMGYLESADAGAATCDIGRIQSGLCTSATLGVTGVEEAGGQYNPEWVASSASDGLKTEIETFGTSLSVELPVADDVNFTSITALQKLDKFLQDDGDGTSIVWFDEQYSVDAEQFTQEVRLNGQSAKSKWVTGLYYYNDRRDLLTEAPTTADAFEFGGFFHREDVLLDSQSWALFGQYEYDFTSQLTGIVGLRYTEEKRHFEQDAGPSFYEEIDTTVRLDDEAVTGKLGLDWRPDPDTLVYGNVSTGFKSGGFSGSYNASLEATRPVGAEDITNLELGYKNTLAGGRVRVNASAFAYEVEGYQAQVFLTVADGSVITNAGDVTGTGAELEVNAQVTDNFEVIAGLGWLDTEFDSDQIFIVAGDEYTFDGNELPSAPNLTYNLVARYYQGLGDRGELTYQVDYSWQDDHFLQIENDPYSKQSAYGLVNAKLSWMSPEGTWTVAAFVTNLTDEEYFTYQNTLGSDWGYGVWGKPRMGGVRLGWKF